MAGIQGVFVGFAIILVVIGAGYFGARAGVMKGEGRLVLNRVAFYIATPALLFVVVAESDVGTLVSPVILVQGIVTVLAAALFIVASRLFFPRSLSETTLGATASGYVNSNNIGLPVGIYVIGEITYVPPLLLLQVVFFSPIILALLEAARGSNRGVSLAFVRAIKNPIIIGTALGLVVALFKIDLPDVVFVPLEQIGAAAIPMVLLAFGASLHGEPLMQRGTGLRDVLVASIIKLVVTPVAAWALAGPLLGLEPQQVYAAVVLAALPTAQNVYNYAATYRMAEMLVRNVVFVTTFLSLPVILAIALLLKP